MLLYPTTQSKVRERMRTGELKPDAREDFVTRRCAYAYRPDAEAPRWRAFIGEVTGYPIPAEIDANTGEVKPCTVGKFQPRPGYGNYVQRYMASFAGFLPAGDPRVVIAVSIDEPRTVYGGLAAAPLFQEIARYAIQRLAIPSAPPVALPPHVQGTG